MHRSGMLLGLAIVIAVAGCENPQTVTETETPSAPAVQQASAPTKVRPEELTETPSGLKYKIIREGEGKKPTPFDTVLAHYEGWLDDGTIFDSSYERGEPTEFPLNEVIKGWTEGLQLIGEGGEIRLVIPGELAYGPTPPTREIPPNATLHFRVELLEVR